MEHGLQFSIVEFNMYVDDDSKNKWFEIGSIKTLNTKIQLIPLFNAVSHPERDVWDQIMFGEVTIVVSVLEFEGSGEFSQELVSYEYPLVGGFDKENIYEINLAIDFEEIIDYISNEYSYSLSLSYYLPEEESSKNEIFLKIMNNTFLINTIPFIKDGGWLDGR